MENASKALIIAGAILLTILIISLGLFVFKQAKDAVGNTGLDAQKASAYNTEFEAYEGTQKGTAVRDLLNTIGNHNSVETDEPSRQISVDASKANLTSKKTLDKTTAQKTATGDKLDEPVPESEVQGIKKGISAGRTFEVSFVKHSGYIVHVIITDTGTNK